MDTKHNIAEWIDPPKSGQKPEKGYDEWLTQELSDAEKELDSGKAIPAEKVWEQLDDALNLK